MKKILFLLAFAFIGQQAFSQIYIVTTVPNYEFQSAGCSSVVLVKVDPTGNQTTTCIDGDVQYGGLITLNQELNSIISQGYQLIETSSGLSSDGGYGGLVNGSGISSRFTFIFAIP